MANEVYLQVPQPLYSVDAELNLMAMLEYVMRAQAEVTTREERRRVIEWFTDRYCNEPAEHEES